MVLIDTSAWVEFLRTTGNPDVEKRVRELLLNNQAAWCNMVRLELWNGTGGERDRKTLESLQENIVDLPIDTAVWDQSTQLVRKARGKGVTIPAADILIAACAFRHKVEVESTDSHFHMLAKFR